MRIVLLACLFCSSLCFSQIVPKEASKLIASYPDFIVQYSNNKIFFKDGSYLIFDDQKDKSPNELLNHPDIQDQFYYNYNAATRNDAGRIRNEEFFKKMYGNTKKEVEQNLVEITWCPKLINQKIKVTTINGIDKIVGKLSNELDLHPEFKKYISNIGGTFNWRTIAGTNRISMHSFGMTIDINTKYSNYWQWDCKCSNELTYLSYKNKIPLKLVKIFEKYGFIWGGNWQHYDSMHFEYRPELL